MKTIAALSACALMALSAPAFAQAASSGSSKALLQNGSPSGASPSHAKEKGDKGTESGLAPTEGRSSANDASEQSPMNSGASGQSEAK